MHFSRPSQKTSTVPKHWLKKCRHSIDIDMIVMRRTFVGVTFIVNIYFWPVQIIKYGSKIWSIPEPTKQKS